MEFMGHQRAFTFLLGTGMIIKAFISDRHSQITKWMKDECPKKCREPWKPIIDHFFWPLAHWEEWVIVHVLNSVTLLVIIYSNSKSYLFVIYKARLHISWISFFHFGLEIKKLLTKLSKEKGMDAIGRWKKACVCHFYWCVTSSQAKLQQVILAKFRSFQ